MAEALPEVQKKLSGPELIGESLRTTAEGIRAYSLQQVGFWKMLPLLGLHYQGHQGYSAQMQILFENGAYRVNARDQAEGFFGTYVDCDSGKLIRVKGTFDRADDASHKEVLEAWLSRDGQTFDARAIVEGFQAELEKPRSQVIARSDDEVAAWRADTAAKLGLQAAYTRS